MSGAGWTPGPWHWVDGLTDAPWSFDGESDGYPSLRTVEKFGKTETVVRDGKHYSSHHCAGSLGIHSGVESADAAGVLMGCLLFFDVFAQDVDGRTTAA